MKINGSKVILDLNGKTLLVDQEPAKDEAGRLLRLSGGQVMLDGGKPCTIGYVLSNILSQEKVTQFNALKAWALAQRFFKAVETEVDESDFNGLRDMIESNERWTPLVRGQILQHFIDVKDKVKKK